MTGEVMKMPAKASRVEIYIQVYHTLYTEVLCTISATFCFVLLNW